MYSTILIMRQVLYNMIMRQVLYNMSMRQVLYNTDYEAGTLQY